MSLHSAVARSSSSSDFDEIFGLFGYFPDLPPDPTMPSCLQHNHSLLPHQVHSKQPLVELDPTDIRLMLDVPINDQVEQLPSMMCGGVRGDVNDDSRNEERSCAPVCKKEVEVEEENDQPKKTKTTQRVSKRRIRTRIFGEQLGRLEAAFANNPYPDINTRIAIASDCKLDESRVMVWFQNRRSRMHRSRRLLHSPSPSPSPPLAPAPSLSIVTHSTVSIPPRI